MTRPQKQKIIDAIATPVPIIALTAHNDTALQSEAQAAGMNGYWLKLLSLKQAQAILHGDSNKKNLRF